VGTDLVTELLLACGLPPAAAGAVRLVGEEQPYATAFPVTECAASAVGAIGATAALLYEEATGVAQDVTVPRGAAGASLVGFVLQQLEAGELPLPASRLDHPLVRLYPTRDGRWVHLHGALPHLAALTVGVLGCGVDASIETVADRVVRWDAQALEDALAQVGTCGAMVRTGTEWAAHPQSRAIAPLGLINLEKIGDSAPEPPRRHEGRPLAGLRVLDLTRVLAGPTNGRTLAEHGADVLLVNSPHLPNVPPFVVDTGHGKRSCHLDLEVAGDAERLRALAAGADVFSQGYRGGALARRGFGPEELAERRPGLVYVTINCYGDAGPWQARPGWEQLAQSVSGIAAAQGPPGHPELLAAAACDYTTGYLAALGTMAALWRRSHEGGSYHVRVSLCQTAGWFTRTPVVAGPATGFGDLEAAMVTSDTGFGRLRHLAPVAHLSVTPPRWDRPTVPLGTHPAEWAAGPPI
jgi:crotonobetainyl-CoA:carnitine CoA-transferase CaiB-like acyl-CoA transferase